MQFRQGWTCSANAAEIMDAQLKDNQRYIETFDTLDDAGALAQQLQFTSRIPLS